MKKILLLVLILGFVPLSVFAELGVGGSAFLNSPVLIFQPLPKDGVTLDDFTFGGDVRFKLSLLQIDALALVTMGENTIFDIYADAGIALDLLLFRLSAGVGPTMRYVIGGGTNDLLGGFNVKANADVKLGRLSVGLSYIMNLIIQEGFKLDLNWSTGLLGATVMFWL